ncbi:MAG: guanylate kinase [Burkholderiales bacterium]
MPMTTGNLFIIAAPSGAGKSSLVAALLAEDRMVRLSVSYTTRMPRPGEINGKDYHFVSRDVFLQMAANGEFLESAAVYGNLYGTSQRWIEDTLSSGHDVLLEIDWQGAEQVRKIFAGVTSIFILPPNLLALRSRLEGRNQDSPEIIRRRLAAAKEDISHVVEFDYVIINNNFTDAVKDLSGIVRTQRLHLARQLSANADLLTNLTKLDPNG